MNQIALIHVTFADAVEAQRIGEALIAERLAACVNIGAPCLSIYRWQGAIERGQEAPATFKTSLLRARRAIERLGELHSYAQPAIELVRAETGEAICRWVAEATT